MNIKRILRFVVSEVKQYVIALLMDKIPVNRRSLEKIVPQKTLLVIDMVDDKELTAIVDDIASILPPDTDRTNVG